jgi:hypothetical protein
MSINIIDNSAVDMSSPEAMAAFNLSVAINILTYMNRIDSLEIISSATDPLKFDLIEYLIMPLFVLDHPKTEEEYQSDLEAGYIPYFYVYGFVSGKHFAQKILEWKETRGYDLPWTRAHQII